MLLRTKTAMSDRINLKGPAVDEIISIVQMMYDIDDAREINQVGLSKYDFANRDFMSLRYMTPGSSVDSLVLHRVVLGLDKYRGQFEAMGVGWDQTKQALNQTYIAQIGYQTKLQDQPKKVEYISPGKYGKLIFVIPGVDRALAVKMYKGVESQLKEWLQSENPEQKRLAQPYRGKTPVFKVYDGNLSGYSLHPFIIPFMSALLAEHGYDVSDMNVQIQPQTAEKSSLKNLEAELRTDEPGISWVIEIRIVGEDELRQKIKEAPYWKWNSKTNKKWQINSDQEFFEEKEVGLISILSKYGYDVAPLVALLPKAFSIEEVKRDTNGKKNIVYADISLATSGVFSIAIIPNRRDWMSEISEYAKNCFPDHVKTFSEDGRLLMAAIKDLRVNPQSPHSQMTVDKFRRENNNKAYRIIDKTGEVGDLTAGKSWMIYINGEVSDMYKFENILNTYGGYDTSGLRSIIDGLVERKSINVDKIPGVLDGFQKESDDWRPDNDYKAFYDVIDSKTAPQGVKLMELQKEGVAFLYGRKSAVLGDSTGAGKTAELILAANMRLEQDGGRCLIVTIPSAQLQWAKEIEKFTGETDVSFDPKTNSKWTILYYNMFAAAGKIRDANSEILMDSDTGEQIRKRDLLVETISSQGNYIALILDESHMVKNNSITTRMVEAATSHIPYRWGATATFIANKSIDAYNQLRIIGDRLGQLTKEQFKEQFCGYKYKRNVSKKGKSTGRLIPGSEDEQLEAAANLRRWLTYGGVYIKRTKKTINPDLPNHTVSSIAVNINSRVLEEEIERRMREQDYKNPAHVLSQLTAARAEIANIKTPFTLDRARSILSEGKRVIVFSCFIPSLLKIKAGIEDYLLLSKIGGRVLEYSGNVPVGEARDKIADDFRDPNSDSRAMMISTLAGGTGLDLPNVVGNVLMNDFSWTFKDAEQSEGRAFRITNINDVLTEYIIGDGIDTEIFTYVQRKKKLALMISHFTEMENQLVSKGKRPPLDIKQKIIEIQKQDKSLDDEMMGYLSQFMGGLGGGQERISSLSGWYKVLVSSRTDYIS